MTLLEDTKLIWFAVALCSQHSPGRTTVLVTRSHNMPHRALTICRTAHNRCPFRAESRTSFAGLTLDVGTKSAPPDHGRFLSSLVGIGLIGHDCLRPRRIRVRLPPWNARSDG
jgi:hypothetical protein